MDSFVPEKLKDSVNKEYVNKFPFETLKEEMFIPINNINDVLYVGIVNADNKERRNSILTKVILTTKLKPKVIAITKAQLEELLEFCKKNPPKKQDDASTNSPKILTPAHATVAPKKRLGEQLIYEGLITDLQLTQALTESKQSGTPIGSVLVKLGFITIEQLREALSKQQGLAHVEAKDLKVEANVIKLLPEDFIKDNKAVPISTDGKTIVVGMVNPNDKQVLNDIIYLTGLKPFPLILTHIEYEKCIDNFFEIKKETERLMEEISLDADISSDEEHIWQKVEKELQDESNIVAKFTRSIITEAIEKKASDIHIEPRNDKYIVRCRIDGILRQTLEIPAKIEALLVSRLKVISRMDISEHRRSQDGHFTFKHQNKIYDLRVNTLPVGLREKMVIRILQPDLRISKGDKRIELVGSTKEDIQKINLMTTSPCGIILATGPTGSGKTTTLYSILNKINNEMVNITTIEDPVEIKLEGINQVQVNPKADITFASCMRSILRQDPDIIMVGEIRDLETLEAAIHASLTGHLVLSTIHTNNATATVIRLVEMGAAEHLIASSLIGVIAQRLVRKLCPACREVYEPTKEELRFILSQSDDISTFLENKIYKPKGCDNCGNTGYVGRLGLYEIMPVNREIKKLIAQSAAAHEIEEIAISCNMKTLQRAGLDTILKGETSIAEYLRVLGAMNE
ncbi:MAG: ATPase, T2SS/T4P/T4SS family [bacterium]